MKQISRLVALFTLLVLLGSAAKGSAQQSLADADWFERTLGEGVEWRHYLFDDLFGSYQSVSYIEVDLSVPGIQVVLPYKEIGRQALSSMIPEQHPTAVAGINGTYFNTSIGGHVTYLRVGGTEIPGTALTSTWGREGAIAVTGDGEVSIASVPSGGWSSDTSFTDLLACGPLVVIDNEIHESDLTAIGSHCVSRHPRSAVGVTADNKLILVTVDGRTELAGGMSCAELGEVMLQLGCVDALNLDGGGSSTLWGNGEPFGGVLNFPSDNGTYDRVGERSNVNGIAIISGAPEAKELDARLVEKSFEGFVDSGGSQTVRLVYENIGTASWTAATTRLVLARPTDRTSAFYDAESWLSPTEPAVMTPSTVGPGEEATFEFVLQAPEVTSPVVFDEHFVLIRDGEGRFGPADSEAWMRVIVQPPVSEGESFIVESRSGGENNGWYSDEGMANAGVSTTVEGATPSIGGRFGSTFRSIAGFKRATIAPEFPQSAYYNVAAAWGAGSNRRDSITYRVNFPGGTEAVQIDQRSLENNWVQIGEDPFFFHAGQSGTLEMTNEATDVSGSMYANAFRFQLVEFEEAEKRYDVICIESDAPVINGVMGENEWQQASLSASGFVLHDDSDSSAEEDASFQFLYDEDRLYFVLEMDNQFLRSYPAPGASPTFESLAGDRINLFFSPFGVSSEPFYRVVLSPNPTDGACHVWSQANLLKSTDSDAGEAWIEAENASYNYVGNRLTVEFSVLWSAFDVSDMEFSASPDEETVWGLQVGIGNELSDGVWEYTNWEPDDTSGFVLGNPFGALVFSGELSALAASEKWKIF